MRTTAGNRITHPPTRCPNGHTLGPNHVLVGHQACLGHGGGHHFSLLCDPSSAVDFRASPGLTSRWFVGAFLPVQWIFPMDETSRGEVYGRIAGYVHRAIS